MAFQQLTFIDTKFEGVVSCNKLTGCTSKEMSQCQAEANELMSVEGWDCGSCQVYCSNTAEMRTLNVGYLQEKCDYYYGGGALVEAKAKCTLSEPKSHAKTVCSNGKNHVFESGSGYPGTKVYTNWDVYYMNEIDQLEEKVKNCDYACQQDSDFKASCLDSNDDPDKFVAQDHKGCYIFSGRFESWWFDSDNNLNSRIEICEAGCNDGDCIIESGTGTGTDTTGTGTVDTTTTPGIDCGEFVPCEGDEQINLRCASGESIVGYTCTEGCAIPTNEICSDGTQPISNCELYQKTNLDGTCSFDITQFKYVETYKAFYEDYRNSVLITSGVLIIVIMGSVTGYLFSKRKGKLRL